MSLIATRLQNWRVQNPEFDRNMTRPKELGALDFFIEQTNAANSIVNENLRQKAFQSMGNTIQIPVVNFDENVEVSHVRSCVIEDNENTSALYNVVFATYGIGFTMVRSLYNNNEIGYQQDFSRKMEKCIRALGIELDSKAVMALEAQKTQKFETLLNYQQLGNEIQVETQMASEILGDIGTMMRANDYPQRIHIIGNAGIDSLVGKLAQHDIYNDVNKRLEYSDKIFHYTNQLKDEGGKTGTMIAVADGNCGILTRVDLASLRNATSGTHEWGKVVLPGLNLEVGSHYYEDVGDQSAIAGAASEHLTCDVKEHYGFSVDVAFITAYNSNPVKIANPIIKAEIKSRAANQPVATPVYVTNAAEFIPAP